MEQPTFYGTVVIVSQEVLKLLNSSLTLVEISLGFGHASYDLVPVLAPARLRICKSSLYVNLAAGRRTEQTISAADGLPGCTGFFHWTLEAAVC